MELKQSEINILTESMYNQAKKLLKNNGVRPQRYSLTLFKGLYEQGDVEYWKEYYSTHPDVDVLFIDAHDTYQLHEDGKIYKLFNKGFENLFHTDEKEIKKWQLK